MFFRKINSEKCLIVATQNNCIILNNAHAEKLISIKNIAFSFTLFLKFLSITKHNVQNVYNRLSESITNKNYIFHLKEKKKLSKSNISKTTTIIISFNFINGCVIIFLSFFEKMRLSKNIDIIKCVILEF